MSEPWFWLTFVLLVLALCIYAFAPGEDIP